jgi:hypothetical protein
MRLRVSSRSPACFAAISVSFGLATLLATVVAAATEPVPARAPLPDPVLIDLGLHLGGVYRMGDAPAFPITGRTGAVFGVSAYAEPSRRYAFGLAFEHAGLGSEQAKGDFGSAEITRDVNVLWGGLRVHFVKTEVVTLSVLLGPGLAWQGVSANGLLTPGIGKLPTTFSCSAGDSVNLALRAGLGARFALGSGVSFLADVSFDNLRLASEVIGDCAVGAGTVSVIGARVGFGYQFDVSSYVR